LWRTSLVSSRFFWIRMIWSAFAVRNSLLSRSVHIQLLQLKSPGSWYFWIAASIGGQLIASLRVSCFHPIDTHSEWHMHSLTWGTALYLAFDCRIPLILSSTMWRQLLADILNHKSRIRTIHRLAYKHEQSNLW
jgi:hypothetical protein